MAAQQSSTLNNSDVHCLVPGIDSIARLLSRAQISRETFTHIIKSLPHGRHSPPSTMSVLKLSQESAMLTHTGQLR